MIDVQNLTRKFGEFVAVHDISFQVERGARNRPNPAMGHRRTSGPLPGPHCKCNHRKRHLRYKCAGIQAGPLGASANSPRTQGPDAPAASGHAFQEADQPHRQPVVVRFRKACGESPATALVAAQNWSPASPLHRYDGPTSYRARTPRLQGHVHRWTLSPPQHSPAANFPLRHAAPDTRCPEANTARQYKPSERR